jgi:Vacuolar segregation subunit 7
MAAPNSSQKRLSAPVLDLSITAGKLTSEKEDNNSLRSGLKTPARGVSGATPTLETVAENSVPDTPSIIPPSERSTVSSPQEYADSHNDELQDSALPKPARGSGDSESDTGGAKAKVDTLAKSGTAADSKPSSGLAKKSLTNLAAAKGKFPEPPARSMTVETETVSSVPQATLNVAGDRNASGKLDVNGSIRLKPSNEMIKAKKDKKKNARRPTSINTGTSTLRLWYHDHAYADQILVSSKADIFEAKVASAVDEANSSDSDETFVYESNPPEPYVPRSARHHSRTPSATSLASQVDQYGARNKSNGKDGQHSVAGKRSMKFANYNSNLDGEYGSQGAGRGAGRTVSTPRHHHISRHARGQSHTGLFDSDSPFTQANKPSSPRVATGRSRPNSPRFTSNRATSSPRKAEAYSWDADEGVADDERMPLIGSVRVNRARHARKPNNGSSRQFDYIEDERRGFFSRHGACFLVTLLFLVMCIGAGAFIMVLSRPLVDVSIKEIKNVLASEQELMLDLNVRAVNPNLFAITVSELNVDIFAKSGFAGSAALWREHQSRRVTRRKGRARRMGDQSHDPVHTSDGVDEGNDPIDDPGSDPQTMVLGRIFEFDSPLVFEPSPIRRQSMLSLGEIRLTQPGNKTEEGGSARWERVIQHPFQLIIGGAVRYQLPLSSRTRSASIRSKVTVDPKDAEGAQPSHAPKDSPLLEI